MSRAETISQVLGVALAVLTAIGCIAYERIVMAYPFYFVGAAVSLSYLPFWLIAFFLEKKPQISIWEHKWALIVFLCSGATAPLWYWITRKQGLLVSSTYEIKYVVILGLFYVWFGDRKITLLMILGVLLAIASVYCLSHSSST